MSAKQVDLIALGRFVLEHRELILDVMFEKEFHEFAWDEKRAHGAALLKLMELVGIDPAEELAELDALAVEAAKFGWLGWIIEQEQRKKAGKP